MERIPLGDIQGEAILLKHGESIKLNVNDDRVFCFPKNWASTEFLSNVQNVIEMQVSNTPEFKIGDASVIAKYSFAKDNNNRKLQLTEGDIVNLGKIAVDDYLYVRFVCNSTTMLTPSLWYPSSCVKNTILLPIGQSFEIQASDKNVYRIIYDDIANYDLTLNWEQKSVNLSAYVASYCNFKTTASDKLKTISVRKNSSTTIKADEVDSWSSSVEEEGFLYVQFSASRKGNVEFVSAKPVIPEPVYTTDFVTICFGETYTWNGQEYSESGEYEQTFTTTNGADSIVTLNLTILPEVPETVENATIKGGDTYSWQGQEYAETGKYTATLADMNGCDSVLVLNLTVLPKTNPCVESSTKLNVGDQITVNLGSAFTVYCINYAEWAAQGATLQWTGAEALHTFVAETCQFAVAPYNKYVHLYLPITTETALDMNALAPYVDDAGYLYIRFLTEKEGVLTVK